jgi:hypothetical protein
MRFGSRKINSPRLDDEAKVRVLDGPPFESGASAIAGAPDLFRCAN